MSRRLTLMLYRTVALTLIIVFILPTIAPAFAYKPSLPRIYTKPFIHSALRDPSFWSKGLLGFEESPTAKLFKLGSKFMEKFKIREFHDLPLAKVWVLLPPGLKASDVEKILKGAVTALLYTVPTPRYTLVAAYITPKDLEILEKRAGVVAVLPFVAATLYSREPPEVKSPEQMQLRAEPLQAPTPATPPYHKTVELTRAKEVWETGNYGQLATIAIIDTGVDYASTALGPDAIARDEHGLPLILEDIAGLVLFPVETQVYNSTHLLINASQMYIWIPSAYEPTHGWMGGILKYNKTMVYVAYCPALRSEYFFEADIPLYWRAPTEVIQSMQAGGKPARFGFLFVTLESVPTVNALFFTVPALIADTDADGRYDSIYFDLTTAYYYVAYVLHDVCGLGNVVTFTAPDFNFADERPVRWGSEIAALDVDGDGIYDFSVGTLAGYYFDKGTVLLEEQGALPQIMASVPYGYGIYIDDLLEDIGIRRHFLLGDWVGGIWPGMDVVNGRYAAIHYDFHSHGTFCATTAAGRPVPYLSYYHNSNVMLIAGQAPGAKIASSNAIYYQDIDVAVLFFSGFELRTPYVTELWKAVFAPGWVAWEGAPWSWEYTGSHQVDITSNSYGGSGWVIWGWASGLDPESIIFDYTSAISRTVHFVAAGNGGPGWGTVTIPGAATLVVTVGAATEFTYRPFYGYLPGGAKEVISWSNRGPAETGFVKPDIVAIGSFAYAVGRLWESLRYETLNGYPIYLVALFGGTSQATPMAAGVAALAVTAYKQVTSKRPKPWMLKTALMNAAEDMGFNPFSQGAGFVDAVETIKKLLNESMVVYNPEFVKTYSQLVGEIEGLEWYEPKVTVVTDPGLGIYVKLKIKNAAAPPTVKAVTPLGKPFRVESITIPYSSMPPYFMQTLLVLDPKELAKYDIVVIEAYLHHMFYSPHGRGFEHPAAANVTIYFHGIELWYWIDFNDDGVMQLNETARIQYDLRQGNSFYLQVAKLNEQLEYIEKVIREVRGLDPDGHAKKLVVVYRCFGNGWSGVGNVVGTLNVVVWGYRFIEFGALTRVYKDGDSYTAVVLLFAPSKPGAFEGYIVVDDGESRVLVPFVVHSAILVRYADLQYELLPLPEFTMYKNMFLRGVVDFTWRYETGDWRVFFVKIENPEIGMLVVDVYWPVSKVSIDYTSQVDVAFFGPYTYFFTIGETSPADVITGTLDGVELAAKLVSAFAPQFYWDDPAPGHARILALVQSPGLYRLVVRNMHYSGEAPIESLKIVVTPVKLLVASAAGSPGSTVTSTVYLKTLIPNVVSVMRVDSLGGLRLYTNGTIKYYNTLTTLGLASVNVQIVNAEKESLIRVTATISSTLQPGVTLYLNLDTTLATPFYTIGYYTVTTRGVGGGAVYYDNVLHILLPITVT